MCGEKENLEHEIKNQEEKLRILEYKLYLITAPSDFTFLPDIEAFEERAAINEYDGRLTRVQAEDLAAQEQGFDSAKQYWHCLATYLNKKGIKI